jgi:hypothetical protein
MMDGDYERTVGGRILKLLCEPALLLETARSVQQASHIRVEAYDRRQWSLERPINVGLRRSQTTLVKNIPRTRRTEALQ